MRKEIKILEQNIKKIANSTKVAEIATKALNTPLMNSEVYIILFAFIPPNLANSGLNPVIFDSYPYFVLLNKNQTNIAITTAIKNPIVKA